MIKRFSSIIFLIWITFGFQQYQSPVQEQWDKIVNSMDLLEYMYGPINEEFKDKWRRERIQEFYNVTNNQE